MNHLEPFKSFYLDVVLPNTPSYKSYFNAHNINESFDQLIENFEKSYSSNPFDIINSEDIKKIIAEKKEPFVTYSLKKGSDVPQSIINKHYSLFLDYNKDFNFSTLQELVNVIHQLLGNGFCKEFQEKRIKFNGNSRLASTSEIFGHVRDDYWTINKGSEREVQYHIFKIEGQIGYGLGFNAQKSMNNLAPIDNVSAFIDGFFINQNKISQSLNDYDFINSTSEDLKNIEEDDFILFGKQFETKGLDKGFTINGLKVLEIAYDLKNKQFEIYKLIFDSAKNTNLKQMMQTTTNISLLKYKKQIILQGPPGTGKTREAKFIARQLIELNADFIKEYIKKGLQIKTVKGNVTYTVLENVNEKIVLEREKGTINTITYTNIINYYNQQKWNQESDNNDDRMASAVAKYLYDIFLRNNAQFKLIQFHPSYTYDDFVRGIVAKPNEDGDKILYEAENKIFGKFIQNANDNYNSSNKNIVNGYSNLRIDHDFEDFKASMEEKLINSGHKIQLTNKLFLTHIGENSFSISSEGWKGEKLKFSEIKKLYKYNITQKEQTKKYTDIAKTVYHRTSYYFPVVEMFKEFVKNKQQPEEIMEVPEELKNYVLVIDEINRANLSSVLGELIYALEYRNDAVESIYEADGSKELILPPNLYIIGTMNTSDRSVGHIDYAIRRRFAFVDILPKDLTDELKDGFDIELFTAVSELFVKDYDSQKKYLDGEILRSDYLSSDFEPKDVWLGHSYFIKPKEQDADMQMRLTYEIKPILLEYVRDGILKESAIERINKLQASL